MPGPFILQAPSRTGDERAPLFESVFAQAAPVAQPELVWPILPAGQALLVACGKSLLVVGVTWFLASRARRWFERATARTHADANTRLGVGRLLEILILVIGALTVLDIFGVPLNVVVASLGFAGLAISLAVQDILRNFFAGLYLLFERPFRIGDLVGVKDQRGVIEHIGIRTTTLRTEENVEVLIPNSTIFAEIVSNRTHAVPVAPEPGSARPDGQPSTPLQPPTG